MPIALLAVERALDPLRIRPRDRRIPGAAGRVTGPLPLGAGRLGLASWLHPWQGITLIMIFAGLAAWRRLRGVLTLALAAAAAAGRSLTTTC